LIAGTPAISIAYREKCIGMMECLDLKNAVVRTDCPYLDGLLLKKFLELNSHYDVMIEKFSKKIMNLKGEIFKLINKILKSLF
jgi:polysaccharide pyruvyl transferase WcaK-like protein